MDLRKRARALCNGVVKDAEVVNAEKDGILNNNHHHVLNGGCDGRSDDGNYEEDYDDYEYEDRRNRRWESLEEQRLLAWRKEKKHWKWIFEQFPDRTEGAVRVRFTDSIRDLH